MAQVHDVTHGERAFREARSRLDLEGVDFLRLLVTQMKYQDPLKPMSDTEFLAEMTQFGILNETRRVAQDLELSRALGLVGHTVRVWQDSGLLETTVLAVRFSESGFSLRTEHGEIDLEDIAEVFLRQDQGDAGHGE